MTEKSRKGRPRVMFICDQELKNYFEEWAKEEGRTLSNVLERCAIATAEARKNGIIRTSGEAITSQQVDDSESEDIEEIKHYIELLFGERERDGISFVLVGQALGLDPEKLHNLHLLVKQCRAEQAVSHE